MPIPVPDLSRSLTPRGRAGFTVLELLVVTAIVGILAQIGLARYGRVRDQAEMVRAIGDIKAIQTDIDNFEGENGRLPTSLAEIDRAGVVDPWGNPYEYFPFPASAGPPPNARRDRFLVPINSAYDLYSAGPDGRSAISLVTASSRDDIVRANDGGFIGPARSF